MEKSESTTLIVKNPPNLNDWLVNIIFMSPVFVAFFFLMLSLCNYDFKGVVWLVLVLAGTIAVYGLQILLSSKMGSSELSEACKAHSQKIQVINFMKYSNPCISSFFFVFTLFYLLLPMQANNSWNMFAVSGFMLIFIADSVVQVKLACAKIHEIMLGAIIGAFYSWA